VGEQICVVVPGANRDPEVYVRPNELDLLRDAPANLSLATGPHLCAGAALARLEAHVAVARYVDAFAAAELAPPGPSYRVEGRPSLRGLACLPVTV
jgi:cytochrome P450